MIFRVLDLIRFEDIPSPPPNLVFCDLDLDMAGRCRLGGDFTSVL